MVPVPKFSINLDLDQKDRWSEVAATFKDEAYKITDYLKDQLPTWAFPIVETIARNIEPYFTDYGDEMIGLADGLGLDLGDVVSVNLIYQLERLGLNCSNWNNTGPTLDDDAISTPELSCTQTRKKWEDHLADKYKNGPSGRCTSIVSMDEYGTITHGRNMDWSIPDSLRDLIIDVDFYRNGTLVATGTTAVGFVGLLNGVRHDGEGWSVSMDARNHGGRIYFNLLQALETHCLTPEQALRKTLESDWGADGFEGAVKKLSDVQIVDDVYYIMAGTGPTDGAVVTRARQHALNVWRIDESEENGWFRVETNYDHWKPVPKADDRRDPANDMMIALGSPEGVNTDSMLSVLKTWPVFNPHTTFTSMINPSTGLHNTSAWRIA